MASFILHQSRMAWPTDWNQIFGREAPILLELGFGGGDKLVELGQNNPSANVLGIEISLPSLRRGVKKVNTAALENVRVLQSDSKAALRLLFQPQTISGATINFPDPWPKKGHQHRRLISDQFLHLLATRMQPGAPLDIATDHEDYAAAIQECLLRTPYFETRADRPVLFHIPNRRPTKYEQIALTEGRTPHYFPWRRNDHAALDTFPIPEVTAVPHVVLLSNLEIDAIPPKFEPFHVQEDDIHIKYLRLYRSFDGDMLFVDVYVSEEPYHQRVGLGIRRRQSGDLVVGVQEIGFPRPTRGIHLAVDNLVSWLREQDPGLIIVNSTLIQQPDQHDEHSE